MVLYYAKGGNFNNWIKRDDGSWFYDMLALENIITGLGNIHEKMMVHRDFHIGNILLKSTSYLDIMTLVDALSFLNIL